MAGFVYILPKIGLNNPAFFRVHTLICEVYLCIEYPDDPQCQNVKYTTENTVQYLFSSQKS